MASNQPIYSYIMTSVVDGKLPDGFNLAKYDEDDTKIHFADGARDGICIYHVAPPAFSDDTLKAIIQALLIACADDYEAADEVLSELLAKYRAIRLIDQIQQAVFAVASEVDAGALYSYATSRIFTSTSKELVKVGLSILEVFNEPDDGMKEFIRTIGLCDEFTIFCAWNARRWTNGNEEVFSLAKRADGWGRIHAIEILEPETDEIREWLLVEGVNNNVMPEYSALTCYAKARVGERLAGEMTREEFSGASSIVSALLHEGPVMGISAFVDPKAELERYVSQAAKQEIDARDCECIGAIAGYAADAGWDDLVEKCDALLGSDDAGSPV